MLSTAQWVYVKKRTLLLDGNNDWRWQERLQVQRRRPPVVNFRVCSFCSCVAIPYQPQMKQAESLAWIP